MKLLGLVVIVTYLLLLVAGTIFLRECKYKCQYTVWEYAHHTCMDTVGDFPYCSQLSSGLFRIMSAANRELYGG